MAELTFVGVGPGDPELLTIAGLAALRRARTVAYPVAQPGGEGVAARIAAPWLQPRQQRLPLHFPMTTAAEPLQQAWHAAARQLLSAAATAAPVVMLCEGDVSLYASTSYVLLLLQQQPELRLRLIPGVTSLAAAAAAARWPLALQGQQLLIAPAPRCPGELDALLAKADNLALLKLGRHWSWLHGALADRNLLARAFVAERVGWPDERLVPAAQLPPQACVYFSLLLIRCAWAPVLPAGSVATANGDVS